MGHLKSDHLKVHFLSDKCQYQPSEAPSLIYRKSSKMLFFDHTGSTIFRKNPIIKMVMIGSKYHQYYIYNTVAKF